MRLTKSISAPAGPADLIPGRRRSARRLVSHSDGFRIVRSVLPRRDPDVDALSASGPPASTWMCAAGGLT